MLIAAFDFGSNSLKALLADASGYEIREILDGRVLNRLGAESDNISDSTIVKTIEAARTLLADMQRFGTIDVIMAAGTEALRRAHNSGKLVQKLNFELGIDLKILQPDEEAELAWWGAAGDLKGQREIILFDSGGASTEFCHGFGNILKERLSVPLGAVSLSKAFLTSDPPQLYEISCLSDYIDSHLQFIKHWQGSLLATGGGITACAKVAYGISSQDFNSLNGVKLDMAELERQKRLYLASGLEERKKIQFLEPERADIIPAGCLLYLSVLKTLGKTQIEVRTKGLRHGLVWQYLTG
jgi:exopolyphosphatase/guanosine-5'-triphosphate,3'-diphosphate pyrophosphatase